MIMDRKIPDAVCWIDCYNGSVSLDCSGTILCGINYRNMHFVQVYVCDD